MTETATRAQFTDADLTHRWATEYRIPVVTNPPSWRYEATLLVPRHIEGEQADPGGFDMWSAIWPTNDEAEIIGSYIDYRMRYYNDSWAAQIRARPLDADSGSNTVTFRKKANGWTYTRASYRDVGFYPAYNQPQFEPTKSGLVALITSLYEHGSHGVLKPFADWMAEHAEVWTA